MSQAAADRTARPDRRRARDRATPWWMPIGAFAATAAFRVLAATWRVERSDLEPLDASIARGTRCIFAFWHARLLPLVWSHRGRGIVVLVSRHRDGEWITRVIENLGFGTVRGSSTRGGEEGLRGLFAAARAGKLLAITPDGPRGPAGVLKPGLVHLARHTGLPVVPVATAADRAWVLRSWDRFRVPRPFARVRVRYGDPIFVPRELDAAGVEAWRVRLERAVESLTRDVDADAGERR